MFSLSGLKDHEKALIKVACLSAPLMAIFRVSPVVLLGDRIPVLINNGPEASWKLSLLLFSVVSFQTFAQWLWNLWLFAFGNFAKTSHTRRYLISYVLCFLLSFAMISLYLVKSVAGLPSLNFPRILYPVLGILANNTIVLIVIQLLHSRQRSSDLALKNARLKLATYRSGQSQLKQRLQPHFLFNALYNLKVMISDRPTEAERYVDLLSELLRDSLTSINTDVVSVNRELSFLNKYVSLQVMRYGQAIDYRETVDLRQIEGLCLPVHSLQILAENAIKHNGLKMESPLRIEVEQYGRRHLSVTNNHLPLTVSPPKSGMGLSNLARRFELLGQEQPTIEEGEGYFRVLLPLIASHHESYHH